MEHFCKVCDKKHLREKVGDYKNGARTRPKFVDETGRAWVSENMCSRALRDFDVKTLVCPLCSVEFTSNKKVKKFCSKLCQKRFSKRKKPAQI